MIFVSASIGGVVLVFGTRTMGSGSARVQGIPITGENLKTKAEVLKQERYVL